MVKSYQPNAASYCTFFIQDVILQKKKRNSKNTVVFTVQWKLHIPIIIFWLAYSAPIRDVYSGWPGQWLVTKKHFGRGISRQYHLGLNVFFNNNYSLEIPILDPHHLPSLPCRRMIAAVVSHTASLDLKHLWGLCCEHNYIRTFEVLL